MALSGVLELLATEVVSDEAGGAVDELTLGATTGDEDEGATVTGEGVVIALGAEDDEGTFETGIPLAFRGLIRLKLMTRHGKLTQTYTRDD